MTGSWGEGWAKARLAHLKKEGYMDRVRVMMNYNSWLGVATPGEVRKHWSGWMGPWPMWAGSKP